MPKTGLCLLRVSTVVQIDQRKGLEEKKKVLNCKGIRRIIEKKVVIVFLSCFDKKNAIESDIFLLGVLSF